MAGEVGFDALMDVLENPRGQMLIDKIAKDAAAHVLLRIGLDITSPQAVIEAQADAAFLRANRVSLALTSQKILELQLQQKNHEEEDARQFKNIIANQNISAQDRAAILQKVDGNKDAIDTKLETIKESLNTKIDNRIDELNKNILNMSVMINKSAIGLIIVIALGFIGFISTKIFT